MGIFSFVKPGKKIFDTITSVGPQVNKTKKEKLTSKLKILQQKTKASGAKLDQTRFELKNKMPLTFGKSSKKTLSNTEKAKLRNDESKKAFKASEGKTRVFYPPKNFNKGGRVGLKGGTNLGMQSVKYGLDNNPKITAADPKAKFIAANKKKKSKKSPMDKQVRKS
jgi:hypothetical protein